MKVELDLEKELVDELKEIAIARETDLNTLISASLKAEVLRMKVFLSEIYDHHPKL